MTDQDRITTLEAVSRQGQDDHKGFADSLQEIKEQLSMLQSNGGLTINIQNKRVKFAGSLPFKPIWVVLGVAAVAGNIPWLTKLLGPW